AELGVKPVVPVNDEYQLYWGFSFGWGSVSGQLGKGPARIELSITRAGQAWRQDDALMLTDDPEYVPVGREKPPFGYLSTMTLHPKDGSAWRGSGKELTVGAGRKRVGLAKRDFSMWTGIDTDPKWWAKQNLQTLTLYDVLFQFGPPADIRDKFHKQYAGKKD